MTVADAVVGVVFVAGGVWAGAALGDVVGAVTGTAVALGAAVITITAQVRPGVAVAVFVGTLAGGLLGRSIVRALCYPESCHAAGVVGAIVTGAGSFVGIGLVVALVMRSFDEFRESSDPRKADPGDS